MNSKLFESISKFLRIEADKSEKKTVLEVTDFLCSESELISVLMWKIFEKRRTKIEI